MRIEIWVIELFSLHLQTILLVYIMEIAEDNPIIFRLKQFIAFTGLSSTQFADRAGIPRPTLSQMLNGRNKSVNNQLLAKLDESFPNLNVVWLLFGRGEMCIDSNFETSASQIREMNEEFPPQLTEKTAVKDAPPIIIGRAAIPNLHSSRDVDEDSFSKNEPSAPSASNIWRDGLFSSQSTNTSSEKSDNKDRRITSIIVLYSDNSFETFNPA